MGKVKIHQYVVLFLLVLLIVLSCEKIESPTANKGPLIGVNNSLAKDDCPTGMISYWKFDGSLEDELGTYNATMGPSGSYAGGKINGGLHGRKICSNQIAARVDNFPNLESFTVEAWIKPACPSDSWQGSLSIAKWVGGYSGPGFYIMTYPSPQNSSDYKFMFHINDLTNKITARTPITYPCSKWYHIVGFRDNGNAIKLFVNGVEVASAIDDAGSIATTQPLTFHGSQESSCDWGMSGETIDEIAVYDRVLSADEILQHYQNGLNGLGYCEKRTVDVELDIRPQSCPNPLNTESKGVLPVAVLGTANLNVNDIEVSTVQLEGVAPLRSDIEDVAAPVTNRQHECDCTSNGADGFDDLTLKFDIQAIVNAIGSLNDGDQVILTLTGNLEDGTSIEGVDCVLIKNK